MSRLPLTSKQPADPELARLFESVRGRGTEPPDLYRTLGNAPAMLEAWIGYAWPLRTAAGTPRALRELMIMRGAQVTRAEYEWAHHWPMAVEAGVPEEKLLALAGWESSPLFDARERAALHYAEEVTRDDVRDATFEELSRHFDSAEVIELTLTSAFYAHVARVLHALRVEVEPEYQQYLPR